MDCINISHLVLPKGQGAVRVGDFWPISLSNIAYLIFANTLENRLQEVIGEGRLRKSL